MIETELYYLAGLLEGEGSFIPHKGGTSGSISPKVKMASKDRYVIEKIAAMTGRKVYGPYVQRGCSMFEWFIVGPKAVELMSVLRPLMSPRRQGQIDNALYKSNTVPRARL